MSNAAAPWPTGTYLRNGKGTTLQFDPAVHDGAQLATDGFFAYDPLAPGDDHCTDTHAWSTTSPCMHEQEWQCPQAPRAFWFPLAKAPKWRDADYTFSHREELAAENAANPNKTGGPTAEDNARRDQLKAARTIGFSWQQIFEKLDAVVP